MTLRVRNARAQLAGIAPKHTATGPGDAVETGGEDALPGPVVAVSDWIKSVPDQIARWVPGTYTSLGTDGFGFSDTRPAARRFFHVDAESITVAVLWELARSGAVDADLPAQAIAKYRLDLPVSEAIG